MAFETVSQHLLFFFSMKGLFCLLPATPWCRWTMKVKGRCLPRLRWTMGHIRTELSRALTPSAPSQVCTHSHAPGKGWHHETRVQSKQCSHLLEDIKSPRVVWCSPPKPTLLWFLAVSYDRTLHHGLFVTVGVLPFQLPLFFRVSKLGTRNITTDHRCQCMSEVLRQAYPNGDVHSANHPYPEFLSQNVASPLSDLLARHSWERVVLLWHAWKIPHLLTLGNQSLKYVKWAQAIRDFTVCLTGFFGEAAQQSLYFPLSTLNFFLFWNNWFFVVVFLFV